MSKPTAWTKPDCSGPSRFPAPRSLGQLKEISEKLAKEEQQPLTIAGLLQRYGYKVPTYNFKEKLTAINDDLLKRKPAVQ
jgi:hypothetical protein